jgi:hypothetical protein
MSRSLSRRQFVEGMGVLAAGAAAPLASAGEPEAACILENLHVRLTIARDGRGLGLIDKRSGKNHASPQAGKIASVRLTQGGQRPAQSVRVDGGKWVLDFGGATVVLQPQAHERFLTLEVVGVSGEGIEELTFLDLPLALRGVPEEPLAACLLAMNVKTNVAEFPRPASVLRAMAHRPLGLVGAKVAIVAGPQEGLRTALQAAVSAAPDLPHSPLGGPWALDAPINRGSYLFNFDGVTEANADAWIALARSLGMTQIDFHGGQSHRFGDCRPNPTAYPKGRASLKAAIDKLHAAGIVAGLHTYAFFIAKDCPWVAAADPRLMKSATFTLAEPLTADAKTITVAEPTDKVSTITGFFVHNSITLRIGQELVTFTGARKEPPYGFTGCTRGAYGTKPAAHDKGVKADHLKECFGLFVPDPETTLFTDVAARSAETFNECGFDMIYLDALDGASILDALGGGAFAWHFSTRFVYEIWKRLTRPALMEMSTFHHHLWCVRSRYCAWDHPTRSHKKFIDLHAADNEENRRMFLPGEFGWWALANWTGPQGERTFPDDIEYLMTKSLATDTGLALMGIDPTNSATSPALPRLAGIVKRYEDLRHSGKVPAAMKAKLAVPGAEFTLVGDVAGDWGFRATRYAKHRVEAVDDSTSTWQTKNPFGRQPLAVRIEALMAAGPYDAADNPVLASFEAGGEFKPTHVGTGVTARLAPAASPLKVGRSSGCLTAENARDARTGTFAAFEKTFSPALNLDSHQGLGLWVHGDGQGELLNLQLQSPSHLSNGIGDHYIPIDFTGWRYFELIEPEGERWADYQWPYGGLYAIYREAVVYGQVASLSIWCNHLPPQKKSAMYLSPIKALRLVKAKLARPSISIGAAKLVFPVEIESGSYLEYRGPGDCKLYGAKGEVLADVKPEGQVPTLEPGDNTLRFECQVPSGVRARANVTAIALGDRLT